MKFSEQFFPTRTYDLAGTLDSGQSFRWNRDGSAWVGIVDRRWVRLLATDGGILAQTSSPANEWSWLVNYLQTGADLESILTTFPDDVHLQKAVRACAGLRLLRQPPWETLASFILSSTKQIVQIRQIISLVCERHGEPIPTPEKCTQAFSFPTPSRLAALSEKQLRDCKMGFRAPYLLEAARAVDSGKLDMESIGNLSLEDAREKLTSLHGVGVKIADCVLLFAYGHPKAFPVDVWIMRALRELYFPKRKPSPEKLRHFISNYFGPHAGYAQQYLFHYMRTRDGRRSELASPRDLAESSRA